MVQCKNLCVRVYGQGSGAPAPGHSRMTTKISQSVLRTSKIVSIRCLSIRRTPSKIFQTWMFYIYAIFTIFYPSITKPPDSELLVLVPIQRSRMGRSLVHNRTSMFPLRGRKMGKPGAISSGSSRGIGGCPKTWRLATRCGIITMRGALPLLRSGKGDARTPRGTETLLHRPVSSFRIHPYDPLRS